jgi:hypothetical protein
MMYELPNPADALTQGDIFGNCPIISFVASGDGSFRAAEFEANVIVLTQACDLANAKTQRVQVCIIHDVQTIVAQGVVTANVVRDQVRNHRVFGWYFLPEHQPMISESIVDLRDIHTLPRTMLEQFASIGKRIGRLMPPYREHMAQHFATTFSRIALPEPYSTK